MEKGEQIEEEWLHQVGAQTHLARQPVSDSTQKQILSWKE